MVTFLTLSIAVAVAVKWRMSEELEGERHQSRASAHREIYFAHLF